MDRTVTVSAIILGVVSVAAYVAICIGQRRRVAIEAVINCFLLASGVVVGAVLLYSAFVPAILQEMTGTGLYVAIGGTSIMLYCGQMMIQEFNVLYRARPPGPAPGRTRPAPTPTPTDPVVEE